MIASDGIYDKISNTVIDKIIRQTIEHNKKDNKNK